MVVSESSTENEGIVRQIVGHYSTTKATAMVEGVGLAFSVAPPRSGIGTTHARGRSVIFVFLPRIAHKQAHEQHLPQLEGCHYFHRCAGATISAALCLGILEHSGLRESGTPAD